MSEHDEQRFTGMRVSVEGSSLPPDNPPRDVDGETERDIIRFREAVRREVYVTLFPAHTYAARNLAANTEIRDAGNALRARIVAISFTPEEAQSISAAVAAGDMNEALRTGLWAKLRARAEEGR